MPILEGLHKPRLRQSRDARRNLLADAVRPARVPTRDTDDGPRRDVTGEGGEPVGHRCQACALNPVFPTRTAEN
jgi:hypothetical protein